MKIKRLIFVWLTAICITANAQIPDGLTSDWVEITKSQDEKSMFYVHTKTIERNGNIVKAWIARVSLNDYTSAKSLQEFNCKTKQLRYLSVIAYKNSNFTASSGSSDEPSSWSHIIPDSIADNQMDILCTFTSKKK